MPKTEYMYLSFKTAVLLSIYHDILLFDFPGIVENMTDLRQDVCVEATQQGIMQWILKRLKVGAALEFRYFFCHPSIFSCDQAAI